MKTYTFKYKATFEGTVEVRAADKKEAKRMAEQDFGLVGPSISASSESAYAYEEGIVDWDFDMHPTKTVIK